MGDTGVRRVGARRARWEGWSRPIACWFRNRWSWRRAKRLRTDMRQWQTLAIPLVQLPPHPEPDVQRMAEMLESLGYSVVLQYGYGKGEALLFAYQHDPKLLRPFIERASGFTLEQLGGDPDAPEVEAAVRARNELMTAVRETVAAHPKELRDSTRP